jgi:hypothetical protein
VAPIATLHNRPPRRAISALAISAPELDPDIARLALGEQTEPAMYIVIGLIAGIVLGALAGSAAVQFASPASFTLPANKAPATDAAAPHSWDI